MFRLLAIKLMFASLVLASAPLRAERNNAVWRGPVGDWNDGWKWSTKPDFPDNGVQTYSATINEGTVTLNQPITVEKLILGTFGVPTLLGSNVLQVNSHFALSRGLLKGNSTLNALGMAEIAGDSNLYGWHLTLSRYTKWTVRLGVGNAGTIDNLSGATLDLWPGAICTYYWPSSQDPNGGKRTLNNYGTINARGGAVVLDLPVNNQGTINLDGGSVVLTCGGTHAGPINLANGATLSFLTTNIPTGSGYVFAQSSSISGAGSVNFNAGNFLIQGSYDITGTTTVGGTISFPSSIASIGSSLVVNGQFANCDLGMNSLTVSNLNLRAGIMTGSGTVTVAGPLEWKGGQMSGAGTTNALSGVFFNELNSSSGWDTLDRTMNCYGNSWVQIPPGSYHANLRFGTNAALNIMPGATFNGSRLGILGSSTSGQTNGTFTNYGTLVIDDSGLNRGMFVTGTSFVNQGTIQVTNSMLDARAAVGQPAFVQNAGSIKLANGKLHSDISKINGGSLTGYGTVTSLVNNGVIAPSGTLTVLGTLNLQSDSLLAYDLSWDNGALFHGYINGYSTVTLGGALQIALSGDAQSHILPSQTFTLVSSSLSILGQFTNVVSGGRLPTVDGGGSFIVTYAGGQVVLSNFLNK